MKNRENQSFTWMKAALPMICRVDMAMPHGVNAVSVNIIGRQRGEPMCIGALLGKALMAVGLFICSVNSDVFHAGVIQILLPSLPPDSVVVMDNATFHKRLDTQKVIDDAGHIIEYLPPYSPSC